MLTFIQMTRRTMTMIGSGSTPFVKEKSLRRKATVLLSVEAAEAFRVSVTFVCAQSTYSINPLAFSL